MTVCLCGCVSNRSQSYAVQTQAVSITTDDVFNADNHTDFDEWEEYEFNDEGIVIGQTVFRSTKDGVVYLVVHYPMEGLSEVYEYDETKTPKETQITWENGNSTKPFNAGDFVKRYDAK